jgi:hypothetical protein
VHFHAKKAIDSAVKVLGIRDANVEQVEANLSAYLSNFQYATEGDAWCDFASDTQRELLENVSVAQLDTLITSLELYGGPKKMESRWRAFCERHVFDVSGNRPQEKENHQILGCRESYFRGAAKTEKNLQPERQLAWFMKTLVQRKSGSRPVEANVLTVVAPALDSRGQPGYRQYVSPLGGLNQAKYRTAMNTISEQIMECSEAHGELSHVALSAAGMDSFLSSLGEDQKAAAKEIGVEVYADLVLKLRKAGRTPVFQGTKTDSFWKLVNKKLGSREEPAIGCLGKIPDCITDNVTKRTLFVNAGDASSLTGNRCNKDRSLDGYWGRSTLLHLQHAVLAAVHNSRRRRSSKTAKNSGADTAKPPRKVRRPMSWPRFPRL